MNAPQLLEELPGSALTDDVDDAATAGSGVDVGEPARVVKPSRRPSFIAGAPIVSFTGANGAGKSLVMVSCAINDDIRSGRPVYSTVPIRSEYGDSRPIESLSHLLSIRDSTVLLDEVAVIFSSRDSLAIPREFDVFLQTLRHKGVTLRWTAPAWKRADVRLREITQVSVGCFILGRRRVPGEFWPRPLSILAGAMDVVGLGVDDKPEKVLKRRIFVPQLLSGWGAYDTHADTPRIGHQPTGGACVDCGGVMRKEPCSGERHQALGLPLRPEHEADLVKPRPRQRLTA